MTYNGYIERSKVAKNKIDLRLLEILEDFGCSVDCQGFDDGDYDTAVKKIRDLFI